MAELVIPVEHHSKFAFFINLSDELKTKLFEALATAEGGISARLLVEHLHSSIKELGKDELFDIVLIYLNLINARNNFQVSIDEFLPLINQALSDTKSDELIPNDKILVDIKKMLISGSKFADTSAVLDFMSENQYTFLESNIYQDIRPVFDAKNNLLGSSIINNLKIVYRENNKTKEIYLSLDNEDIDHMFDRIKDAKEKIKLLTASFPNAKFIKIN